MDKSIKRFIKCLKGYIKWLRRQEIDVNAISFNDNGNIFFLPINNPEFNKIKDKMVFANELIQYLETPKEKWESDTKIFNDFDVLSIYLNCCSLTIEEKFDIIIFFIERNIAIGILTDKTKCINLKNLEECDYKKIMDNNLKKILYSNKINILLQMNNCDLSSKEIEMKKIINELLDKYSIDINDLANANRLIKDHYLNKRDSYNIEDIDIIDKALLSLKVDEGMCKDIICMLKRNLNKRTKEKQSTMVVSKQVKQDMDTKNLSNNEYNLVERELRNYFNFKNMKSLRPLSINERIYVLSLLKKLKYDEDTIYKFLKISEIEMNMKNPIALYNELYEKLKYYEEKYGLSNELQELEQYFSEIFISDNDDYKFWKSCIENNLNSVLKLIPRTYEYEFSKASNINE